MNTDSGEWANIGSELMGYDAQLELSTVINHKKPEPAPVDNPVAWTWDGALDELTRYCPDGVAVYGHESPGTPVALYRQQPTHKPLGVRLAKMLSQYDDSPSSQLWSDIQRLAREILR